MSTVGRLDLRNLDRELESLSAEIERLTPADREAPQSPGCAENMSYLQTLLDKVQGVLTQDVSLDELDTQMQYHSVQIPTQAKMNDTQQSALGSVVKTFEGAVQQLSELQAGQQPRLRQSSFSRRRVA